MNYGRWWLISVVWLLLAGSASASECTLRVGAYEAGQGGLLIDGRPSTATPLDSVTVKAISKSTKRTFISYRVDNLSYFERLPEGDYRIVLSVIGFETTYEPFSLVCDGKWTVVNRYFGIWKGSSKSVRNNDVPNKMRENVKTMQGDPDAYYGEPVVRGGEPIYVPPVRLSSSAAALKYDGNVIVDIEVDRQGKVVWARASEGHPKLIVDCENAAYYALFSPKFIDDRLVTNSRSITYVFKQGKEMTLPIAAPKTISGGVLNGKAMSLPKPAFPAAARAVRVNGTIDVAVLIDEKGVVTSAKARSGRFQDMTTTDWKIGAHPLLISASESAALAARFSPTLLDGHPVKVTGIITYTFIP